MEKSRKRIDKINKKGFKQAMLNLSDRKLRLYNGGL